MLLHRLPILMIAALAAGCSESTLEPNLDAVGFAKAASAGGPVHQVNIGGPDVCSGFGAQPGCDANFSLLAQAFADGSVSGQWIDRFSQNFGGGGLLMLVDCVEVDGNRAWIGGHSAGGLRAIVYAEDRGTSFALEPDDLFVPLYGDWGSTTCHDRPFNFGLNTPQGQVTIR